MADVTLMNATYYNVPAVDLPADGGGTARFYEATDGNNLTYGLTDRTLPKIGVGQADYAIIID